MNVGVALGLDRICAAVVRGTPTAESSQDVWSRPLRPAVEGPGWQDLGEALAEMHQALGIRSGVLHIALVPPLVEVRRLELPCLREVELRRVLTRDVGRYFLGLRSPQVIAAVPLSSRRVSPVPVMVAAADAGLVEEIYQTAEKARQEIAGPVPGYFAWEAASVLWPQARGGMGHLVVRGEERTDVLRLERGRLTLVRRLQHSDGPEIPAGSVFLESPDALAAVFAPRASGPELLPESTRQERRRRVVALSRRLWATACALALAAAGLELWGAHRELDAITARREAMARQVTEAMAVRTAIEEIEARIGALASAEGSARRWSATLASVAEHLPRDAYLVELRGSRDSLQLEGVARQAAGVFESFHQAPGMAGVRAQGPIRQEAQDSQAPVERFSLAARLNTTPLWAEDTP
jgi:hypothetical protein